MVFFSGHLTFEHDPFLPFVISFLHSPPPPLGLGPSASPPPPSPPPSPPLIYDLAKTIKPDHPSPSSSSSSSSSSMPQCFIQWCFPLHLRHNALAEPETCSTPLPDSTVDPAKAFRTAELHFSSGAHLFALYLLMCSLTPDPSSAGSSCPPAVMAGVAEPLHHPGLASRLRRCCGEGEPADNSGGQRGGRSSGGIRAREGDDEAGTGGTRATVHVGGGAGSDEGAHAGKRNKGEVAGEEDHDKSYGRR